MEMNHTRSSSEAGQQQATAPNQEPRGIVGLLIHDLRAMLAYISEIPWPATRIFTTGAILLLLYKVYCTKWKFYNGTVRPIYDFNFKFFELGHRAWWYLLTFVLLFLTPLVVSRYVDKLKPKEVGIGLGDWRFGLRWSAIFLGVMLPVVFIVSFSDVFANKYPLSKGAIVSLDAFLVWEALAFLYFVGWEFYFRGYLLFGLYKYFGAVAVFIPMIPFVILHSSKPLPEALGAVLVAELLCVFALRAGSFWYGMVVHWTINAAMDIAAVWQRGGFIVDS